MQLEDLLSAAVQSQVAVVLAEVPDVGVDLLFNEVTDLDVAQQQQVHHELRQDARTFSVLTFR